MVGMLVILIGSGVKGGTVYAATQSEIRPNSDVGIIANVDSVKTNAFPRDISPETYQSLLDELMHVRERRKQGNSLVRFDGELRYHYAFHRGNLAWGEGDASGFRFYGGVDAGLVGDWHAYGVVEADKNIRNYYDEGKLSRLYIAGKTGESTLTFGTFGYLMAEGNMYDSGFNGMKVEVSKQPIQYLFCYGKTAYTRNTGIVTVRYSDFDYSLEAGAYHYTIDDGTHLKNTILTVDGRYNFDDWRMGLTFFHSYQRDSMGNDGGFVLHLNYGELKSYRKGTYEIFVNYYDQSKYTYIFHGMNGMGNSMQGFRGYEIGVNYAFAKNMVAGMEFYNLTDKISGAKSRTFWNYITYYF